MAAPKGNKFWELRSTHGREKLFKTPALMWEAAVEYFQWCEDNPLTEVKLFNTKDFGVVEHVVNKLRAYTLQGLCMYLDCNTGYFNDFERALAEKMDNNPSPEELEELQGFSVVIKRIRETIFRQKFEGAAADLLNPNIIARELHLFEKKQETPGGNKKIKIQVIKSGDRDNAKK